MRIKNFNKLSEIQKQIVIYLADFIFTNGWTPTLNMIVRAMEKYRSQSGTEVGFSNYWAILQLKDIEKKGSIVLEKNENPGAKMSTMRRKTRPIKINFLDKIVIEE